MTQQKKMTAKMGLAYEPSLNDGRYQVSGTIGSRSQIFTKDSVFKKPTPGILSFAIGF
jgi:hypothetical protein